MTLHVHESFILTTILMKLQIKRFDFKDGLMLEMLKMQSRYANKLGLARSHRVFLPTSAQVQDLQQRRL